MAKWTGLASSYHYLPYHYVPTEWVCIMFVVLFSLSTVVHVVQAVRFRLWWLFPTAVLCGLLEIIGWNGRLWSSKKPHLRKPFLMQIATTIVAPTSLVAANFIISGWMMRRLGPQFCRLSPKLYSALFLSFDIVALVVQSVGGGLASGTQPTLGGHIALGGIAIQLMVLILYVTLVAEFLIRFTLERPVGRIREGVDILPRGKPPMDTPMKYMIIGLSATAGLLLTRSVYRMIELAGGWNGRVISMQWLFVVFDGTMVLLAMFTLNVCHPGVLLRGRDELEADTDEMKDWGPQGV